MWQAHYYLATRRISELQAEADQRRHWAVEDSENGRPTVVDRTPSWLRSGAARVVAAMSRGAARFALRLDGRVCVDAS